MEQTENGLKKKHRQWSSKCASIGCNFECMCTVSCGIVKVWIVSILFLPYISEIICCTDDCFISISPLSMTGRKRVSSKFTDAYFLIPSITFGARAPNCCNHIKEQVDALAPKVIRFLALCVILGMNEGWAMRAGLDQESRKLIWSWIFCVFETSLRIFEHSPMRNVHGK